MFPNPATSTLPVAREMRRLAKDRKDFVRSQQAMEGFLTAKLVTEALQRAGRQPTPADYSGGKFVKMSVIDERGEFLQ